MADNDLAVNSGNRNGNGDALNKMIAFFKTTIKHEASDLHLKANSKARIRLAGEIRQLSGKELSNDQIEEMIFSIMTPAQREFYKNEGAVDFAYDVAGSDRFRVNVFRQRGLTSVAARRVTSVVPTVSELHLPPHILKLSEYHQGMVLLSGITGSGKSTTIAAMIQHLNETRACHIVTIEDPIEYIFKDNKAFINQREIGIDVANFHDALKYLMREDPDVVLIGEMRDRETFAAAMQAAETGHLVFGTIHASTTAQTITRLLDLFPAEERSLIRQSLVFNLRAIITQKLLPSINPDIDRVPAVEIMMNNPSVRKLIADARETDIIDVVRSNYAVGMQDFNESLHQLIEKEWIEVNLAYEVSPNPEELKMKIKGIKTSTGSIIG